MKRSLIFDIFKIAVPLAAAFTLLIACSDTHPAPAAKAKPATTPAATTATAAAATTSSAPAATPATKPVAKSPAMKVNLPSNLLAQAKVPLIQALVAARKKVPGGRPISEELERENGKLIYTFDLVAPGASGTTEVNVDAIAGSVLAVQHESASAEQQEKKEEKAAGEHR